MDLIKGSYLAGNDHSLSFFRPGFSVGEANQIFPDCPGDPMIRTGLARIVFLTAISLLPLWACKDRALVQGTYLAESPVETQANYQKLVLNLNGHGFWVRGDERLFFKWETDNNKIWLHTKTGGVVSGNLIKADRIEIMVPGAGIVAFKKMQK